MADIVKTNSGQRKKEHKKIAENIPAKIFKRLGAILSRIIKIEDGVAANKEHIKKISKKITSLDKEVKKLKNKIINKTK